MPLRRESSRWVQLRSTLRRSLTSNAVVFREGPRGPCRPGMESLLEEYLP